MILKTVKGNLKSDTAKNVNLEVKITVNVFKYGL